MTQTVLVTGASRSIGLEFVRQYAERGAYVLATCRRPDEAGDLADLAQRHSDVEALPLDVACPESVTSCAQRLAGRPVDVLINNAAIYGARSGALGDIDIEEWLEMVRVNTIAPLMVTRALLPNLQRSPAAKVIGISSTKASIGRNQLGASYPYRSAKAGLNAVLRSLARDLRHQGVAVFALSPGWVDQGEDVTFGRSLDQRLRDGRQFLREFGGLSAHLTLTESVTAMVSTIESSNFDDTGSFFDHEGKPLPW